MSDNFKGVLKQANNEITGDSIRTGKGGNEDYAKGHETIFGKQGVKQRYVGMNYKAECSPMLTQCPRCNNPHNACDGDVKLYGGVLGGGKSWIADRAKAYADATYDDFQQRMEAAMQRLPEYLKWDELYD